MSVSYILDSIYIAFIALNEHLLFTLPLAAKMKPKRIWNELILLLKWYLLDLCLNTSNVQSICNYFTFECYQLDDCYKFSFLLLISDNFCMTDNFQWNLSEWIEMFQQKLWHFSFITQICPSYFLRIRITFYVYQKLKKKKKTIKIVIES